MATPAYVDGATGCQKGIGSAETGVKISTVSTIVEDPEIPTMDENGTEDGFCHSFNPSVTMTLAGEIAGSTGLMTAKFGTAHTIANEASAKYATTSTEYFGVTTTGGWYLIGTPTIDEDREGLKSFNFEFKKRPDIT